MLQRKPNATRFCITATQCEIGKPVKVHICLDVTILDTRLSKGQSVMIPLSGTDLEAKKSSNPVGVYLTVFRVKG